MSGRVVHVAGTRSFAAEAVEYAEDAGYSVAALLEPRDPERVGTTVHGRPVMALDDPAPAGGLAIVGTGDVERGEVVGRLAAAGWEPASIVHPAAHVSASCSIGPGVLIAPGVVVGAHVRIGAHAVIGRGALIGHDTEIADLATLGPGANVAGNTRIGPGAFVAMGAVVRDHVSVGDGAMVAMGAVVTRDVGARARVRGLPAR